MFLDPGRHLHGDGFQAKHLLAQDPRAVQTLTSMNRPTAAVGQTSCVRRPAGAGPPMPPHSSPRGQVPRQACPVASQAHSESEDTSHAPSHTLLCAGLPHWASF